MAPRIKPKATITNLDRADEALQRLAAIDREQKLITQALNEQVDALKASARAQLEPLDAQRKDLENDLGVFAVTNKAEFFGEHRNRSQDLTFGIIGFRRATRLLARHKMTWGAVLERLISMDLFEAIRTKREVDKTAMADWSDEKLEAVGVRRETSDEFYIELKPIELPQGGQA